MSIKIYGSITGKLPIQNNNKTFIKKLQTKNLYIGLNIVLLIKNFLQKKGIINIQAIKQTIRKIPNNLLLTALKTAYKGEKYHSGTICAGVTNEFAITKYHYDQNNPLQKIKS